MKSEPAYQKTWRIRIARLGEPVVGPRDLDSPDQLAAFWRDVVAKEADYEPEKEQVVVILLNCRLRPTGWHRVSLGSVNESICHPRDVLRPVIVGGAHGFALMHNHPSGVTSASRADHEVTMRVKEAAELMQIRFIDHVIVGSDPFNNESPFSYRETGRI